MSRLSAVRRGGGGLVGGNQVDGPDETQPTRRRRGPRRRLIRPTPPAHALRIAFHRGPPDSGMHFSVRLWRTPPPIPRIPTHPPCPCPASTPPSFPRSRPAENAGRRNAVIRAGGVHGRLQPGSPSNWCPKTDGCPWQGAAPPRARIIRGNKGVDEPSIFRYVAEKRDVRGGRRA